MTTSLSRFVISLAVLLLPGFGLGEGAAHAQDHDQASSNRLVLDTGFPVTLVVRRVSDGRVWVRDEDRAGQRFVPASTFKIPNSLIILDHGDVADPDKSVLAWDGVERSSGWDVDLSLREAFQRSAVWAYQYWARGVGHEAMAEAVDRLDYGNEHIGSETEIDQFWLSGPLRISALEQIDFLERLHARTLDFPVTRQEQVIDMMRHDAGENWVLRAKTGWGRPRGEPEVGWFVGWLETPDETWIFATNLESSDYQTHAPQRRALSVSALCQLEAFGAAIDAPC